MVQELIGIDVPLDPAAVLKETCRMVPDRHAVVCFCPGHSTSPWRGGPLAALDGRALCTILSYLANSPFVAYLDDDSWWADDRDHLAPWHKALIGAEPYATVAPALMLPEPDLREAQPNRSTA